MLSAIQKDADLKLIPIVVLSIESAVQNEQRALEAGATNYFEKPHDYDALVRIIKEVTGHC